MLEIIKAEGVFMFDSSGKKYLDLISGVSVSNTGHRHPKVVEAVKRQLDLHMHLMVYGEMIQYPQVRYAELLAEILPSSLNTCYFVNSGSEAVEGALKLAKKYTGRSRIVSFKNSYHGSTHGALSVQGSERYKNPFRPLLPDVYFADFNDLKSLSLIDCRTACVITEPVQAEAGVVCPADGFLEKLRQRCTETGALLIFDEVQTGLGRTGSMFAFERYNAIPDILVLAKALGGGMPLGAFIASREIMSVLMQNPPLGHITTFGGHPVCCAAGLASLEVIIEENLINECTKKSDLFRSLLKHQLIKEVKGEGLLLAVKLPAPEYAEYAISSCVKYGIILDYFLFCNDSFRIAPPLTISNEEISLACSKILELLDDTLENVKEK